MDSLGIENGLDSICQTLATNRTKPAQKFSAQLRQVVQAHGKNLPQYDDFTTVVVKRSGVGRS